MKRFLIWTLKGFILLSAMLIIKALVGEFDKSRLGISIVVILIGSLILGLIFYLLELKFIPWRKQKLMNKLVRIFSSTPISENIAYFKLGGFDFFAEIEFKLEMSEYSGSAEIISFHIPRQQIDRLPMKPDFKFKNDSCNGIETYRVFQTNGLGLKHAKKQFEKRIGKQNVS